jgi:hypothetical protein
MGPIRLSKLHNLSILPITGYPPPEKKLGQLCFELRATSIKRLESKI